MDWLGTIIFWGIVIWLFSYFGRRKKRQQLAQEVAKKDFPALPQELPSDITPDSKSLIKRNADIIRKCLDDIYAGDRSYYIDNEVKDCIGEIAEREGRSDLVPKYREWLSQWETRDDIPNDYKKLKDYLKKTFREKHNKLKEREKEEQLKQEKEEQKKLDIVGQKFFEKNKDLIDKFLEITERKVSIIDDYGDENWDALPEEIYAILLKIAKREETQIEKAEDDWGGLDIERFKKEKTADNLGEEYEWLEGKIIKVFKEYHESQKQNGTSINGDLNGLSGVEFESYIAKVLKDNGFIDVRGTPATGDQGADLIAKKDDRTIIIQAKRYKGSVGNKAVQEVVSAIRFYGGTEGWVITNSIFTPSAKALAQKNNIKLIDGHSLARIKDFLK